MTSSNMVMVLGHMSWIHTQIRLTGKKLQMMIFYIDVLQKHSCPLFNTVSGRRDCDHISYILAGWWRNTRGGNFSLLQIIVFSVISLMLFI